jgi:putative Holliday junction resolvase
VPGPRILAIDYGRRRIGLAISDELRLTAQPLGTLVRKNRRDDLRRLRAIARTHHIGKVLVGQPIHLNGAVGEMAAEAGRFAARMQKELGLPVELVDERLTSWEAEETLAELKHRRSKASQGANVDDVAAAVLLREYLERVPAKKKGGG